VKLTRWMCASLLALTMSPPVWAADGWLNWRGSEQVGSADDVKLAETWQSEPLWTLDLASRGTPVIADGVLYAMAYRGDGPDLRELLVAVNADTGELLWEVQFRDFLSDIIYDRYAIASPTVDPQTGVIYAQTSNGVLFSVSPAGELLWEVSMMERYGRLSFPNGRTGAPVIDAKLVIVHGITANWGRHGPARDRFYAFDKSSGELVWVSTPGVKPVDSSFSTPYIETRDGVRRLYAGTGCGQLVAVNVRTGEPLWRAPVSIGGVNVSPVVHKDTLIAVHAKENIDDNTMGRMVAFDLNAAPEAQADGSTPVLKAERWRTELASFTSSPVLAEGVLYQVTMTGELVALDPETGAIYWSKKLSADQLHASPLFADGKLYVPFRSGEFVVLDGPSKSGVEDVTVTQLAGSALGAPVPYRGRVYVHTTEKLYAFGASSPAAAASPRPTQDQPKPEQAVSLQVLPAEFLLQAGEELTFRARSLDSNGAVVDEVKVDKVEAWIPPTAKVRSKLEGAVDGPTLRVGEEAGFSAGAFQITAGELVGTSRGRSVPALPYNEDFEAFELAESHGDVGYAYPPLSWIGARFKWEVQAIDGSKALAKTLSKMIFQRSTAFIGHPDSSNYGMEANVKVDGNRRARSTVGLVHQRYIIALKGNQRQLEVSSNYERFRHGVPFEVETGLWYTLKSVVTHLDNGDTTIRAKAWPKGEPEPEEWMLDVVHPEGHARGAPGIFGFSPQNLYSVYVDDLRISQEGAE
jgi:outer membrane protein assembly factor BamB